MIIFGICLARESDFQLACKGPLRNYYADEEKRDG